MKKGIRAALFFLAAAGLHAADNQSVLVEGRLADTRGRPVADASIVLYGKEGLASRVYATLSSSAAGKFSTKVAPGAYDVFISSTCFAPVAQEILAKRSETVVISKTLDSSNIVMCDEVPAGQPAAPFVPSQLPEKIQQR